MAGDAEPETPGGELRAIALDLAAGSVGGMAGVLAGHPLDVVKTRMQADAHFQGRGTFSCLFDTAKSEGAAGLWRGIAPPLFAVAWWQALVFASYEWSYKRLRTSGVEEDRAKLAAGFISGGASCLVTVPTDAVKIQLQLERGSRTGAIADSLRCGRYMVAEHGVGSLFRGMSACLWRDVPNVAFYLVAYSKLKEFGYSYIGSQDVNDWRGIAVECAAGGAAGGVSWACAVPMDVVKTIQQEAGGKGKPLGLGAAISHIYGRHGVGGFTLGMAPVVLRAVPVNAITFLVYERMKNVLGVPTSL